MSIQENITRILAPELIEQVKAFIDTHNKYVVTVHMSPDGDAVGSAVAMSRYLRAKGKEATIIYNDKPGDNLRFIDGIDDCLVFERNVFKPAECQHDASVKAIKEADAVICLDYNVLYRLGDLSQEIRLSEKPRLLIDHHLDPSTEEFSVLVSCPELSAACEVLYRLILELGDDHLIGREIAEPLYCGMMTDTGGFTYASTRPEIYEIIGLLLTKGIDKDKIYRNVFNNFSIFKLKFWGYVLYEKLHYIEEKGAAYFAISKEELSQFHYIKGFSEGLVNEPLQIKGCRLSISLREDTKVENKVWVSLRSVDDMNCIEIAEKYFNGGGHFNAAGGQLNCSIIEAEEITRKAIASLCKSKSEK